MYPHATTEPDWSDAPWIAGLGITAAVGHYCFTRACAAADASVVIPVDFVRLMLDSLTVAHDSNTPESKAERLRSLRRKLENPLFRKELHLSERG